MEQWKAIKEVPHYAVSESGQIRNTLNGNIIKQSNGRHGYKICALFTADREKRIRRVNRIVCEAFHGPAPSPKHEAAHCDGNKINNHYKNLRWATRQENLHDRLSHGTHPIFWSRKGTANHSAKLSESDVREIRRLHREGAACRELVARFPVSATNIQKIIKGQIWKHI